MILILPVLLLVCLNKKHTKKSTMSSMNLDLKNGKCLSAKLLNVLFLYKYLVATCNGLEIIFIEYNTVFKTLQKLRDSY